MSEIDLMSLIKASMSEYKEPKPRTSSSSVQTRKTYAAAAAAAAAAASTSTSSNGYWRTKVADDEAVRSIPSKRQVKRACSSRKVTPNRSLTRENGVGPGSSRSTMIDFLRATKAEETFSIVLDAKEASKLPKHMKSTTSRGIGNVLAGNVIVDLNPKSGRS